MQMCVNAALLQIAHFFFFLGHSSIQSLCKLLSAHHYVACQNLCQLKIDAKATRNLIVLWLRNSFQAAM